MARAVPKRPVPKKAADKRPDFDGPIRSTTPPRRPADIPRNRMAMEKAQVVSERVIPMAAMTGFVSTLHAYTLPMQMWIPTAARAINQRFFFFIKNPSTNIL